MNKVQEATKEYLRADLPEFDSGDTVAVNVRVRDGKEIKKGYSCLKVW